MKVSIDIASGLNVDGRSGVVEVSVSYAYESATYSLCDSFVGSVDDALRNAIDFLQNGGVVEAEVSWSRGC